MNVKKLALPFSTSGSHATAWTEAQIEELKTLYPKNGKAWCMEYFLKSEGQIRSMASRMQIKAKGTSEAWKKACENHSIKMTGRKRPEQAKVMERLHKEGKLLISDERKAENAKRLNDWREKNGHPKGATGMKHSVENKREQSKRTKAMWENMDDVTREKYSIRASNLARSTNTQKNRNKASWKAGWRDIGGRKIYARSAWEANYARVLNEQEKLGKIYCWEHEADVFWFDGIKRGVMSYLPDFKVTTIDGSVEYHEVKGWMDSRSKTTIKRMGIYHKNIKLLVIEKKEYLKIRGEWRYRINDWED